MSLPASDTSKQPDNLTTMDLGEVLPRTAEVRDNHLFIGGVDMVKLAREEGTALYVFDEADLRWRMETYREAFRSRYETPTSSTLRRPSSTREVVRISERGGLCLDVSGNGRLACAQMAGFPMGASSCTATTRRRPSCAGRSPQVWAASWTTDISLRACPRLLANLASSRPSTCASPGVEGRHA